MLSCTTCGHIKPDDQAGCLQCETALAPTCPNCAMTLPAGSRFCMQCGTRLVAEASVLPSPETIDPSFEVRELVSPALARKMLSAAIELCGERREVTVLFLDGVNFTSASHSLDNEMVYLAMDEVLRLLAGVVYKYEGTVDKFTGDGLMALFGAPIAHENDPERAVRAALEMQSVIQEFRLRARDRYGLDFQARIGINTGSVIAGKLGNNLHLEYTVIGDTVNLASRLESAAEPGAILVSFETYQRTRPIFNYDIEPPLQAKGYKEPIIAARVVGLRSKPDRVRGLPGLWVPMVGRADVLDQMLAGLRSVTERQQGHTVFVIGSAGVGKSRLLSELFARIDPETASYFEGQCLNYARSQLFWVVADIVRQIFRITETTPTTTQMTILRTHLHTLGLPENEVLPYLLRVLGMDANSAEYRQILEQFDVDMLERQTHLALRRVFRAQAQNGPVVFAFEDIHWIDAASLDFLTHLIRSIDDLPILLIFISRSGEYETDIQPLIKLAKPNEGQHTDIHLRSFSHEEANLLVDRLIGHIGPETEALKKQIVLRAGGNPLYIEELLRMLIDHGGLIGMPGAWQATAKAFSILQLLPGTIRGLILSRFDRQEDTLRQVLHGAAVLGHAFPFALIQDLTGTETETLKSQLDALIARQFLTCALEDKPDSYRFQHALIQEVVYDTILLRDRQTLHLQVARAIETRSFWPADSQIEMLAYHFSQSSEPAQAIPWLIKAARNAARLSTNQTAVEHFRKVLKLIAAHGGLDPLSICSIHIDLARSLKFLGEYTEAKRILITTLPNLQAFGQGEGGDQPLLLTLDVLRDLADVCTREGGFEQAVDYLTEAKNRANRAMEFRQKYARLWRTLQDRLAWVFFRQGRLDEALTVLKEATADVEVGEEVDAVVLASIHNTKGGIYWQQGELAEAVACVKRSLHLYETVSYSWGIAVAFSNLGVLHDVLGEWRKAIDYYEKAYALQQSMEDLEHQARTLDNLGILRMSMGFHDLARKNLEASRTLRIQLGDIMGHAQSGASIAQLDLIEAHYPAAVEQAAAALQIAESIGSNESRVYAGWVLALAQTANGDHAGGAATAENTLNLALSAGLSDQLSDCWRAWGGARRAAGAYGEAIYCLEQAATLAREHETPYRRGVALFQLGQVLGDLSETSHDSEPPYRIQALSALQEAETLFATLGASYDLELVHQALQRFAATKSVAGPSPAAPAVKTDRLPDGEQRRVAVLWLAFESPANADAEDLYVAQTTILFHAHKAIAAAEGVTIQRPNTLIAVFGAPVTHEDDCIRAIEVAVLLLDLLRKLSGFPDGAFAPRAGIAYGTAIAGHIGNWIHSEFVVQGRPLDEAGELAQAAPAGALWVSEAVRSATEQMVEYRLVPKRDHPEMTPSEVTGLALHPAKRDTMAVASTPFVGRKGELATLLRFAGRLAQGIGGCVWVQGEAGIGKSRLIQEFIGRLALADVRSITGQCLARRTNQPFSLFSDLFASLFEASGESKVVSTRTQIDEMCKGPLYEHKVARPILEVLFGVKLEPAEEKLLHELDAEQLQNQMFVTVRRLLMDLTAAKPLLVVLDNLHWIDSWSAKLLRYLFSMAQTNPILFVCVFRSDEVEQTRDHLGDALLNQDEHTLHLYLEGLTPEERSEVLDALGQGKLAASVRTHLADASRGNPYYLEELYHSLATLSAPGAASASEMSSDSIDLRMLQLPDTLEALVHARVDRLSAQSKQLLQYGAVIGRPFSLEFIQTVTQILDVAEPLYTLQRQQLMVLHEKTGEWQVAHSLLENVVYNSMLALRQRLYHLRTGEALALIVDDAHGAQAGEIAYHFSKAGENLRALDYYVAAGEWAAMCSGIESAVYYFERAAEIVADAPPIEGDIRWRIFSGMGDVYRLTGRYEEAISVLNAGLALAETLAMGAYHHASLLRRLGETAQRQGDLALARHYSDVALPLLEHPEEQQEQVEKVRIQMLLAWTHFMQGDMAEALEVAQVGLTEANAAGSLGELASAENLLGGIYYRNGDLTHSIEHTEKAMALRQQLGYTWGVAAIASNLGILAVADGQWAEAKSHFEASLSMREQFGDIEGAVISWQNLAMLYRDVGDLKEAEEHFWRGLRIATERGMGYHIVALSLGLAEVLSMQGRRGPAESLLRQGMEQAQQIDSRDLLAEAHFVEAKLMLASSTRADAYQAARRAAILAENAHARRVEVAACRLASQCALELGKVRQAHYWLTRAQSALDEITDQLELARIHCQTGLFHHAQGDAAQALEALRTARNLFTKLGAKRDLAYLEEQMVDRFDAASMMMWHS